jgi:NIMA (never in mitosis gene a)-related kinase 1/4/5
VTAVTREQIGDLGIARLLESSLEQCRSVVGTPYYMAPELCASRPYSAKADVWSLGCVFYELCTLQHAFVADSLFGLIFRITAGEYAPIDAMRYSSGAAGLVASLLEQDPKQRPSCRELLAQAYVQGHLDRLMMKVHAHCTTPSRACQMLLLRMLDA